MEAPRLKLLEFLQLFALSAHFLFEILEARGDVSFEVLEAPSHSLLGPLDPFFDRLKPGARTPIQLLDALVYCGRLVRQSS